MLLPVTGVFLYVILSAHSAGPGTSGLERTGASGGSVGCGDIGCHGTASTSSTSTQISLYSGATLVTQYIGGASYTLRIKGINTVATTLPKFGFQLSTVKTSTTTNAGTFVAPAGTHLVVASGINIVEHNPVALPPTTGTGGGGSTYVVDIPWTAPAVGTGNVTVYGVINLVNNDGNADAGDKWRAGTLIIPEVSSSLPPITGTMTLCRLATTTLSHAIPGGTWSSGTLPVATVDAVTGVVTGIIAGTANISYNSGASGIATCIVTVNNIPASITGMVSACTGTPITLADVITGGTWSSSVPAVGTVSAAGVVTGLSGGTTTISYTLSDGCAATKNITINPMPDAGVISGPPTVCVSHTATLANTATGGTWSSGNIAIATVNSSTGIVTGVAAGTVIFTYTVSNSCGSATATRTLTVQPLSACSAAAEEVIPGKDVLKIFPNPGRGAFTLSFNPGTSESAQVLVTNLVGIKVAGYILFPNTNTEIKLNQPPGIYYVTAIVSSSCYTGKIVIE